MHTHIHILKHWLLGSCDSREDMRLELSLAPTHNIKSVVHMDIISEGSNTGGCRLKVRVRQRWEEWFACT